MTDILLIMHPEHNMTLAETTVEDFIERFQLDYTMGTAVRLIIESRQRPDSIREAIRVLARSLPK